MTHKCVSEINHCCLDKGLSPDRRQAIICTNGDLLLIGALGAIIMEILMKIRTLSFTKMRLKILSTI